MKFIAGVVVGLVLASAATAIAAWENGASLMEKNRTFQLGYAAGASDMLHAVVETEWIAKDASAPIWRKATLEWQISFARGYFKGQADCLQARSKGNLGQFMTWAEHLFLGREEQAASILLDQACQ